jgi:ribosomal protein S12 methylthiotransferase
MIGVFVYLEQMQIEFQEKSLFFTSLGCSKNLVDSQVMLGKLGLAGYQLVAEPEDAELIVVNTCSFIEESKKESIDTILEMADYKQEGKCQALVMAGCMAQRYSMDLENELPEVDLFIGTGEYHKIDTYVKAFSDGQLQKKSFVEIPKYIHTEFDPRMNTSPHYTAWLKVSEGCNRNCTFCIIPTLRGRLRSRSVESLVEETKNLVAQGVREINIISQDLSDYGVDLPEDQNIVRLLTELEKVEGLDWIRLFYYYPDDLTEELIETIKNSTKICHYLDMPVQHFSSKILRRMNRKITTERMLEKIEKLKTAVPNIILRTSIIVGFPGETEEDFQTLLDGIEQVGFDHLGVFRYSDEEGTPAVRLKEKLPEEVINKRFDQVYALQREIVKDINQKYLGKTLKVLVEGHHDDTDLLLQGRHQGQAPDIDGKVIINDGHAQIGDIVDVEITEILDYDLLGRIIIDEKNS